MMGGIAYHDFIISGLTGEVFQIQHIIDEAQKDGIFWDDAIIELEWLSVSGAIIGVG